MPRFTLARLWTWMTVAAVCVVLVVRVATRPVTFELMAACAIPLFVCRRRFWIWMSAAGIGVVLYLDLRAADNTGPFHVLMACVVPLVLYSVLDGGSLAARPRVLRSVCAFRRRTVDGVRRAAPDDLKRDA